MPSIVTAESLGHAQEVITYERYDKECNLETKLDAIKNWKTYPFLVQTIVFKNTIIICQVFLKTKNMTQITNTIQEPPFKYEKRATSLYGTFTK